MYLFLSLLCSRCCLRDTMQHSKTVQTALRPLPPSLRFSYILSVSQLKWKLPVLFRSFLALMSRLRIQSTVHSNITNVGTSTATMKLMWGMVLLNVDSSEFHSPETRVGDTCPRVDAVGLNLKPCNSEENILTRSYICVCAYGCIDMHVCVCVLEILSIFFKTRFYTKLINWRIRKLIEF